MYEVRSVHLPPVVTCSPPCSNLSGPVSVSTPAPSLSPEILSRHKQHAGYRHCQGTVVTKQQTKTKYVECALSACGETEILMPAAETPTSPTTPGGGKKGWFSWSQIIIIRQSSSVQLLIKTQHENTQKSFVLKIWYYHFTHTLLLL